MGGAALGWFAADEADGADGKSSVLWAAAAEVRNPARQATKTSKRERTDGDIKPNYIRSATPGFASAKLRNSTSGPGIEHAKLSTFADRGCLNSISAE